MTDAQPRPAVDMEGEVSFEEQVSFEELHREYMREIAAKVSREADLATSQRLQATYKRTSEDLAAELVTQKELGRRSDERRKKALADLEQCRQQLASHHRITRREMGDLLVGSRPCPVCHDHLDAAQQEPAPPHEPTERCVDTCDNPMVCRDLYDAWMAQQEPATSAERSE